MCVIGSINSVLNKNCLAKLTSNHLKSAIQFVAHSARFVEELSSSTVVYTSTVDRVCFVTETVVIIRNCTLSDAAFYQPAERDRH